MGRVWTVVPQMLLASATCATCSHHTTQRDDVPRSPFRTAMFTVYGCSRVDISCHRDSPVRAGTRLTQARATGAGRGAPKPTTRALFCTA